MLSCEISVEWLCWRRKLAKWRRKSSYQVMVLGLKPLQELKSLKPSINVSISTKKPPLIPRGGFGLHSMIRSQLLSLIEPKVYAERFPCTLWSMARALYCIQPLEAKDPKTLLASALGATVHLKVMSAPRLTDSTHKFACHLR